MLSLIRYFILKKKHIIEMDLSDNAFGPAGAKPLMKLLINNRNITTLKLNNNGLGIQGAALISSALIEAHEKNIEAGTPDKLKVLMAGRNRMETPGASDLSKALGLYECLERVQMYQNSIRPDGIQFIMEQLKKCAKLEYLDLQDNTFTESGSRALAHALPHWPSLKTLRVDDCLLSAKGGILVIQALTERHEQLVNLYLGFNEIDEKGAQLISAMLKNKKELTKIELNGNCFEAECDAVDAIQAALSELGHPEALDELDEMEVECDEDGDEEETEDEDKDVDDLADALNKAI
jgi:Ran GTPase-activating protein 1